MKIIRRIKDEIRIKRLFKIEVYVLKQQEENEDHLPTRIRISAKKHEVRLFLEFIENGNIENIYKTK